ncbi:DeoR/GlpR family DNA-binding transcription regulator [Amorphus orientalis]|uniref:DeoR family glycerol-3-phosphate regulon repressor n=1 Tax=Amorphus orientalis TaxID=649198 RepID=A0AAE3VP71_9HYPH|nr:DeoR/GlpR family DNA-binding transcription regulator [Amorphus orientalis]MDQ0316254.1 DeoR family glycerol-3-phosphate regulon repressor [Amorphus orientalis]
MNISLRQEEIVGHVRDAGFVTVETLAELFGVTPQTIRRDINTLCDANLLRRRHGGAELLDPSVNASYESRRVTRAEAKRRIAAEVARRIPNHASVMIGIGTTPEIVAQALRDHEDLTVVTNNLNVAMALAGTRSNRIFVPGGMLRLPDRDFLGGEVEAFFRSYRADFGIFGVGGIDPDGSLLDFDHAEIQAREAIRESSHTSILVADLTKFGRRAAARGGRVGDADLLVTDAEPQGAFATLLTEADVAFGYPGRDRP